MHTRLAVVEGEVLHGVLLVADRGARSTTVEGEITHEPTRAYQQVSQ